MVCQSCNATNADGAHFCSTCGGHLDGEATRQSAAKQATIIDSKFESMIGRTISARYRIDAKLGAGGMGAVYRATRLLIGDEVAVKILHSEQSEPKAAERFQREAQAAARLKHPNAVTIHDFGVTDDGLQYFVMELVEGESLRRIIKQQGPLTPSATAEIINQACAALDEAHRHNIIHRDIKPDNIMVDPTATGLRVKVLDFGIAKLRDDAAGNLTQTGSLLGTPHYMSPEQCLGEELDSRSDIYSLGVVLFEMLTGFVPFNSPTSAAVVVQQVTQPPPPPRSLNPSIPPAVESVVFHALQKQREARPQTAGALAVELTTALNMPGVGVRSADSDQLSASRVSGSGSMPTMVLTDRSSGQRLVNPGFDPSNSNALHNDRNRKTPHGWVIGLAAVVLLSLGIIAWLLIKNGGANQNTDQGSQKNLTPDSSGSAASPIRVTANASSIRAPISIASYQAGNALDRRLNTAWVEGSEGPGIGEWLRFDFDREINLRAMTISPGYFKSPRIWVLNNRVAAGSLQFSDGTVQRFRFPDRMEEQKLDLRSVRTSWVKLVIEEVYFGKDPDTAISEVSFDFGDGVSGRAPAPPAIPLAETSFDAAELRIRSGQMIGTTDLAGMSAVELRRLRNAVFARHGRMFDSPDLQAYFSTKPWYSPRYDYSERDLTPEDKANLNLISTAEKGAPRN